MEGKMFNFSGHDKNLVTFVSVGENHDVCTNALLLIPGVTDGFMSMAYSNSLARELKALDYSLVQAQISSSFMQFGFSSIQKDCEELTALVLFLKEQLNFKKIVLLGHSTGAQDSVYFLRHSMVKEHIEAVILQGAVGDRDIISSDHSLLPMLEEARQLREEGKGDVLLCNFFYDAPVTASRFLSLAERLSDEDMFSVDLTKDELGEIFRHIKIPISLCFSSNDEYVSNQPAQREMAARLVRVLKDTGSPIVECHYYDGNHGLSEEVMYMPFVKDLVLFLKKIINIGH
jgi:pimeloyl-ACP methyl ester carboxylesterase